MAHAQDSWTEADSALYRQLASIAVPDRDEQFAVLLTLVPYARDEAFRAVELGCGEGLLAEALLDAFPHATVLALDGSASMREAAAGRLARFGARATVAPFDLLEDDWLPRLDGADLVWASLSVHHRDGPGKQSLFRQAAARTSDRAAFLLADVVEPPNGPARGLFADVYDHIAESQSLTQTGGDDAYAAFVREQWNCYRYPDPVDIPSPLADQVAWLREAGFAVAGSFWQHAGHAVYGGYKRLDAEPPRGRLAFADALDVARRVLGAATDPIDA